MRDFYDIHVLLQLYKIDYDIFALALERTAKKRESLLLLENAENVLKAVNSSDDMKKMWTTYQKKFRYARSYTWDDMMWSIRKLSVEAKLNVENPSDFEK